MASARRHMTLDSVKTEGQTVLRVAQATQSLWKSRPEIQKFGGFLEMASACALRLPSVASRVFRTEVGTGFQNAPERKVYQNDSEYEYEDERSGDSEYV